MTGGVAVDRVLDGAVARVPARVGLVGNPSDGFGGAVLAAPVAGLTAEVRAAAGADVRIGRQRWASAAEWRTHVAAQGHGDAGRIISASLWTLAHHLDRADGVHVTWSSTIPRSVGLAGSSALAVATIDAVAALWRATLDRRLVAALALAAEVDVLGIAAGWQDRIVQAFAQPVIVDAAAMGEVEGVAVPSVTPVRPPRPIRFVVGWSVAAASSSAGYHAALRRAPERHATAMLELGELARRAAAHATAGDVDRLADAMDEGWQIRQSVAPLRSDHAAIVEQVRALGVAATTPGSGGSVVALVRSDDDAERVCSMLARRGCASTSSSIG